MNIYRPIIITIPLARRVFFETSFEREQGYLNIMITTILMIKLLCVLIGKILLDLTLTKLPADFLCRMNKITP